MTKIPVIFLVLLFVLSCNKDDNSGGSTPIQDSSFTDARDGQVYTYRKIGIQVWMTKNLNFNAPNSWTYGNNAANGNTYGRLYSWSAAMTAAPAGWHLPTDEDWTALTTFLGGVKVAGGVMKSTSSWTSPNTGATNSSGFSALPGGYGGPFDFFAEIGTSGYWWSSSDTPFSTAFVRKLNASDAAVERFTWTKNDGMSVRCVRN